MPWENKQKVDSPYKSWPGHIVIPKELDGPMFDAWWKASRAENDEGLSAEMKTFSERHHLVLECHLNDPDGKPVNWDGIQPNGLNLPSMKIALFVIEATQKIIVEARSLPKLPELSSNGEKPTTAQKKTKTASS